MNLSQLRGVVLVTVAVTLLAVTGLARPTPASAQPRTPGRYIIETSSSPAATRHVNELRRAGISVPTRYRHVLDGFAGEFTASQLRKLEADPSVVSITPDVQISVSEKRGDRSIAAAVPWGLDRIDQRPTAGDGGYRYDTTGKGVTAFVIDSGIRFSHDDFGGRAASGYDFVDNDRDASDCEGHGTHVAGTIGGATYGVAKKVHLVSVRVFDCKGRGFLSAFLSALDWVVAHKPAGPSVVNFSGGGAENEAADNAVTETIRAGIPVVIAAGNDSAPACDSSPGRVPQAITVAASDRRDGEAYFSNFGSCVDLFAPGVDVVSAGIATDADTEVMSGTSMAAPHVTGAIARYLQNHPTATASQTAGDIVRNATPNALDLSDPSANRLLFTPRAALTYTPTQVEVKRNRPAQPLSAVAKATIAELQRRLQHVARVRR